MLHRSPLEKGAVKITKGVTKTLAVLTQPLFGDGRAKFLTVRDTLLGRGLLGAAVIGSSCAMGAAVGATLGLVGAGLKRNNATAASKAARGELSAPANLVGGLVRGTWAGTRAGAHVGALIGNGFCLASFTVIMLSITVAVALPAVSLMVVGDIVRAFGQPKAQGEAERHQAA